MTLQLPTRRRPLIKGIFVSSAFQRGDTSNYLHKYSQKPTLPPTPAMQTNTNTNIKLLGKPPEDKTKTPFAMQSPR
jgi:hypothetical protein